MKLMQSNQKHASHLLTSIRARTRFYLEQHYQNLLKDQFHVVQHLRHLLIQDETVLNILKELVMQNVHDLYLNGRTQPMRQAIENASLKRRIMELLSAVIQYQYRLVKSYISHIIIDQSSQPSQPSQPSQLSQPAQKQHSKHKVANSTSKTPAQLLQRHHFTILEPNYALDRRNHTTRPCSREREKEGQVKGQVEEDIEGQDGKEKEKAGGGAR